MAPDPAPSGSDDAVDAAARSPNDANVPLRQRAAAAGVAAFVSAVVVNPLDVVKTRIQAQSFAGTSTARCGVAGAGAGASSSSYRALALASAATSAATTRAACAPECNVYHSSLDVVRKIARKEGLATLWRGTSTALLIAVPTVGIYLPVYDLCLEELRRVTREFGWGRGAEGAAPLIAGATSRTLAVLCVAPLDLVRTRLMAYRGDEVLMERRSPRERGRMGTSHDGGGGGGGGGGRSGGVWAGLAAAGRGNGGGGGGRASNGERARAAAAATGRLWTGVLPTLARDVPYSAMYWFALEHLRDAATAAAARSRTGTGTGTGTGADSGADSGASPPPPTRRETLGINFFSGAIAGGAVAALTTPLDVVKTRVQIRDVPTQDFAGGVRGGGGCGAGGNRGVLAELLAIARAGGAKDLFAGWAPRAARAGPTCGIVLVAYEMAKSM